MNLRSLAAAIFLELRISKLKKVNLIQKTRHVMINSWHNFIVLRFHQNLWLVSGGIKFVQFHEHKIPTVNLSLAMIQKLRNSRGVFETFHLFFLVFAKKTLSTSTSFTCSFPTVSPCTGPPFWSPKLMVWGERRATFFLKTFLFCHFFRPDLFLKRKLPVNTF